MEIFPHSRLIYYFLTSYMWPILTKWVQQLNKFPWISIFIDIHFINFHYWYCLFKSVLCILVSCSNLLDVPSYMIHHVKAENVLFPIIKFWKLLTSDSHTINKLCCKHDWPTETTSHMCPESPVPTAKHTALGTSKDCLILQWWKRQIWGITVDWHKRLSDIKSMRHHSCSRLTSFCISRRIPRLPSPPFLVLSHQH